MSVKKVEAYMSSDGNIFKKKEDAEKKEQQINRDKIVVEFMKENFFPGMTETDFGDALEEFYDLIIKKQESDL